MSDQRMNASDQGTQPDSGSAPNDQVAAEAAGGKHRAAPAGSGTQPQGQTPKNEEGDAQNWNDFGRDNIQNING
jgi:hypothetical protein